MGSLSIPAAALAVSDLTPTPISDQRLLREAQRGTIPTCMVGARLKVEESDVLAIAQYFIRIEFARMAAVRMKHARDARRAARAARLAVQLAVVNDNSAPQSPINQLYQR